MSAADQKPLRALHVYRTYFPDPPGGVQEAIRQICQATAPFGVDNTVFTLSPDPEPTEVLRSEARVIRSRSWAAPASCDLGGLDAVRRFSALAREADVVLHHFPWPFADVLHALVHPPAPAVMLYHSDVVRQRWLSTAYAPLMRHTLASMSAIVATSPAYAQTSPVLSSPSLRDKVHVIPLGICEDSSPQTEDAGILRRLGLAEHEPFFFFIGVPRYYKGLHTLITAAQTVQARVVIAGSGPELAELQALVKQLGANNVLFAGRVSDAEKFALLRHCRAFVLPSHLRSEAFGVVLVEASMCGRPMISCEIGTGTTFVNQHEETGLVVPPADAEALARAMNILLQDEGLAARFGRAARSRYAAMFSGPALGKAYSELFRDVLSMSPT